MSPRHVRVLLLAGLMLPLSPASTFQPRQAKGEPPGPAVRPARAEAPAGLPAETAGVPVEQARFRHGDQVISVTFSPDGKTLISGGQGRSIRLWDLDSGKERLRCEGHPGQVWTVAYSPDGKLLASASEDRSIRLWDPATGKEIRLLQGHFGAVWSVAFAPDGKTLASASEDGTVRLWDPSNGKEIRRYESHHGGVWPLAFAPDGKTLASGGKDGTIRVWETFTGKEVRQLLGHHGAVWPLAFAPDGKTLASGGWQDQSIRLWEVATGKERSLLRHPGGVKYLALSPDGKTLASGGGDGTTRLWEVATGKERRRFGGHQSQVMSVAFSPDGKRLASGSSDTTALVWNLTSGKSEAVAPADKGAGKKVEALWTELAAEDAAKAHQVIWTMVSTPLETVPFLQAHIQPFGPIDGQRIHQYIADLDHDQFLLREQASKELEKVGKLADPALRKALLDPPSLEVRRRVERLLERLDGPLLSPDLVRLVRSLEVLEYIGSRDAQKTLQTLAQGAPDAWLTQEAKAALDRLARRPPLER